MTRWRSLGRAMMSGGTLLGLAVAAIWWLSRHGVDAGGIITHGLYYLLALTLPGIVVLKAALGTRGTWIADLVWGTIAGLCLELLAWAMFVGLGGARLLFLWPLATLALLLVPPARRRILEWPREFGSPVLVVTASLVTLSLWVRVWWPFGRGTPLPPTDRYYYVDIPWHLGLINEATRAFPMLVPQAIETGALKYSWFVHAHLGASSLITGEPAPTLLLRLWLGPMILLGVFGVALLAERLSGRALAGALAALLVGSQGQFEFWSTYMGTSNYFMGVSPTLVYSHPVTLLTVALMCEAVRGRLPRSGWPLLLLAGVVCAGSKSSAMLMLTGAVIGTAVIAVILRRRIATMAVLTVGAVALTGFAMALVSGGGDSSKIQLFGALTLLLPFRALGGDPAFDQTFATDLVSIPDVGGWLLAGLLVAVLLRMVVALGLVMVPFMRRLRIDLAAWLLGGIMAVGWLGFLLMSHDGYSQYYFMYGVIPYGAVAWGWALALLVGRVRARFAGFAAAAGVGLVVSLLASLPPNARPTGPHEWAAGLQGFVVQALVVVAVLTALIVVGRRLRARVRWFGMVGAGLAFGAMLVPSVLASSPVAPGKPSVFAAAENRAAQWIANNTDTYDVFATNTACTVSVSRCDARRWWISGQGGRRVLVEGWRYTPDGADGMLDDYPALAVNSKAFAMPSEETIAALRDRGVDYAVVEQRSGFPKPNLSPWARVVYRNELITIYRLTR